MWNQLIQLSFRSKVGLQAQIREMLVAAILDGHIPVGVALPSTRVLALQLGVARNTVALAYERLATLSVSVHLRPDRPGATADARVARMQPAGDLRRRGSRVGR